MTSAPPRRRSSSSLHLAASLLALSLAAPRLATAQRQQQRVRPAAPAGASSSVTAAASVAAPGELPLKLAPRPTTPAITAADLMTRLYIFADDSMMGREAGTVGNVRGTDYIAAEVRRIGLEPAGDTGTFFQTIPMVMRTFDARSSLAVEGGSPLDAWSDYAPVPASLLDGVAQSRRFDGVRAIYGGRLGDTTATITPDQAAGKLVVLAPAVGPGGAPSFEFWNKGGIDRFRRAAGVAIATLDISPPGVAVYMQQPQADLDDPADTAQRPLAMLVTRAVAERMIGAPLAAAAPGTVGRGVRGSVSFAGVPTPAPARNVVAILRGSDPRLAGEYVAIGAHNDHVGIAEEPVEHDSLRAFNHVARPLGAESEPGPITRQQATAVKTLLDSLRRRHPARADSINNGADDDGSGTVSVLEIAQALAARPVRPKRSIVFVWHTGEEKGMFGSRWFTDHPTVPRDSIVAQLNIDMIGRGDAADLPGLGSPKYLQLIGSRRLSTELGNLVERVNTSTGAGFAFDYQFDANGHPLQYYCRSDHYEYARYGIPIVFFSTGGHQDYHQVTDEPQYIDYDHMARVASFVRDVAVTVADLDHRVVVDKPKPDPAGTCKQ